MMQAGVGSEVEDGRLMSSAIIRTLPSSARCAIG
jgi:hypothetical protein